MEPIECPLGVLGPLESLVCDLMQHFQNHMEALGKLEEIRQRFQSCHRSLSSMKSILEQGWPLGFPQESKKIFENDFSCIRDFATSWAKQLEDLQQVQVGPGAGSLRRMIMKAKRATRTKRLMKALQQVSVEIENYTRDLNSLLSCTYHACNLTQLSTSEIEAFMPVFNVPRASGLEVLDCSSRANPEGEVKYLLLGDSRASKQVAAAPGGGHTVAVPSVLGMGGVGKTMALIGLGYDADIRKHFSDGVHFLVFGQQAGPADVIARLAILVRDSGGRQIAKDISACSNLCEAVHKAALWFSGRTCLFLCDDLWPADGRPHGFLPAIRHLLDTSASSKMVISTRDRTIAHVSSHHVLFEPKFTEGELALSIFLRHAGLELNTMKAFEESAERLCLRVLAFCGGLPIALGVTGRLFRKYLHSNDPLRALRICLVQLERGFTDIGDIRGFSYPSFNATIKASLDFLERDRSGRMGRASSSSFAEEKSIPYLFEALCVMKNQARLPISVLHKLWDVTPEESILVIEALADLNVIAQHIDEFAQVAISAHDLVLAYSRAVAERSGREHMWHRRLLNSGPQVDRASFLKSPNRMWGVERYGYSCRYTGSEAFAQVAGSWPPCNIEQLEAISLASGGADGDLFSDKRLLKKINVPGCSAVVPTQGHEKVIYATRNALHIFNLVRNENELGFESDYESDSGLSWRSSSCGSAEFSKFASHTSNFATFNFTALSFARNARRLVSGTSDGKVRLWNAETKKLIWEAPTGHTDHVLSVAISSCGNILIAGSLEGTVHIWKFEGNEHTQPPPKCRHEIRSVCITGIGRRAMSSAGDTISVWSTRKRKELYNLRGDSHEIFCLDVSDNGKYLVSGSRDGTLRLWNLEEKQGHPIFKFSSLVSSVSISSDCLQIAASSMGGTTRIFNTSTKTQTGVPIRHPAGDRPGVSINYNGSRLIVSTGEYIAVWAVDDSNGDGDQAADGITTLNIS